MPAVRWESSAVASQAADPIVPRSADSTPDLVRPDPKSAASNAMRLPAAQSAGATISSEELSGTTSRLVGTLGPYHPSGPGLCPDR